MRGALVALILLATPLTAFAQGACPGRINATALAPMPSTAMLAVKMPNDDQITKDFQRALFAALRRSGFLIGTPPTHALSWRGEINPTSSSAALRTEQFSGRDRNPSRGVDDLSWVQGVPKVERDAPATNSRIEGSVDLRDLATGRVIWSAQLSCAVASSDEAAVIGTLIGVIVPAIGQTVRNREF